MDSDLDQGLIVEQQSLDLKQKDKDLEQSVDKDLEQSLENDSEKIYKKPTLNIDKSQKPKIYQCGSCKNMVQLNEQDPIRCKDCGYRILYKLRSERPSEYMAR